MCRQSCTFPAASLVEALPTDPSSSICRLKRTGGNKRICSFDGEFCLQSDSPFLLLLPSHLIASSSPSSSSSHRTKEDELEEIRLREELKAIDAALKKYKKQVSDLA